VGLSEKADNRGRWAVVLGASSGTGAAVARAVSRDLGMSVFGVHRGHYLEQAAALESEVAAEGRRIRLRLGDAGTPEGAALAAEDLFEVAGPKSVKLFIHSIANASVGALLPTEGKRLEPRHFHKTFDAMAHSFVYWAQELVTRDLLAPGAHLIGLSNSSVDHFMQGTALIAGVKAALAVYVRHLAQELGPRGHQVSLLKFAAVSTPAVLRTFGEARFEQLRRVLEATTPARRMCTVEEVAHFVTLLVNHDLQWFNGATIDFTGSEFHSSVDALLGNPPGG
jgi:NAD(P)-dependent dehydrogenase (short-subunit alcohol dehydrogenase family)